MACGRGRRQRRAIVLAMAMALVVTACGNSGGRAGRIDVANDARQPSSVTGRWPTTPSVTETTDATETTTTTITTSVPTITSVPTTTTAPTTAPTSAPTAPTAPTSLPPPPLDISTGAGAPASPDDMTESPGITGSAPLPHPWPTSFEVGDAAVARVPLFASPGVRVPDERSLPNPTFEGVPLVFLVRQNLGDWLQVQIQSRPNGATAWIRRSDVTLRTVNYHIVIERGAQRVSLYHGEEQVLSDSVATGLSESPTPLGAFYVDYHGYPTTDSGPYGALQLSVTGYSEVYRSFGGGIGQIALHGTNRPDLIGSPASAGCVRMYNPVILRVGDLAPTGTPVSVYA